VFFLGLVYRGFGSDDGRRFMSAIYLISGLVALALLVYLGVALLKPEKF
jgi:K+-transporting ATPase KdpF subunit